MPLVRRLLRAQRPDPAEAPLRLVANGWDNAVLRLGDQLAVRVPRRTAAAGLLRHEQLVLPAIAARVPVAVPAPVHVGVPGDDLPWHWSVVPWFPGRPVADSGMRSDERLAVALAGFLRALHVPTDAEPWNPVRGVPLQHRAEAVDERLASGLVPRAEAVGRAWRVALEVPPWTARAVQLHGDLHPANLIAAEGHLAAVVDFGDTTAGDPATDLATGWLSLDAGPRALLRRELEPDDATWERARGWAIGIGTSLVTTAEPGSTLHAIGAAALDGVLRDP